MNLRDEASFVQEFYSRQLILKEIGEKGQAKLSKSKVAIVGVGGLGTVSSLYLALAGVGYMRLIDQDIVEAKNLHRQILYNLSDLDYPKAEVAALRLQKSNPLIKVDAIPENVNASNVERLLSGVDLVVDGLDNMTTRYLVNRVCVKLNVPYVFGAAIGMEGNLSVFYPPQTPCLECIMPNLSDNEMQRCDTRGVIGATPGIIGSMQALEAIKLLTAIGEPLKSKLMICDFTDMTFTQIEIAKNPNCPACKGTSITESVNKLVWLCGRNTVNINPEKAIKLDLKKVSVLVEKLNFSIRVRSHFALVFDYKGLEVTLFSSGRALIKNIADEKTALKAYREIGHELHLSS